jgi:hypothetical protein
MATDLLKLLSLLSKNGQNTLEIPQQPQAPSLVTQEPSNLGISDYFQQQDPGWQASHLSDDQHQKLLKALMNIYGMPQAPQPSGKKAVTGPFSIPYPTQ